MPSFKVKYHFSLPNMWQKGSIATKEGKILSLKKVVLPFFFLFFFFFQIKALTGVFILQHDNQIEAQYWFNKIAAVINKLVSSVHQQLVS